MEYYSFEKVLKELQMEEDELKRLVSEGEIRAFRDEDKMKFKKSDIDGLKKGRMTEPTIILPSGEQDDSSEDSEVLLVEEDTSETLLDIDDLDNAADSSSTSVPTVDFSSSEFEDSSASETITEELTFEEDSGSYVLESSDDVLIDSASSQIAGISSAGDSAEESGDTFIDSDTGLQTEPLDDVAGVESADDLSDTGDHTVPVEMEDEPAGLATVATGRGDARGTKVVRVPAAELTLSPVMLGLLAASTLLMLFTGSLMLNSARGVDNGVTGWWTDLMYQTVPSHVVYDKNVVKPAELQKHLLWRERVRSGKK